MPRTHISKPHPNIQSNSWPVIRENIKLRTHKSEPLCIDSKSNQVHEHRTNRLSTAKDWIKAIALAGAAQSIVQAIGFISGILVIRLLTLEEYAYYTIVNSTLGTMTILTDGGVSTGVMSEGGKVWQDKKKLGAVVMTGIKLRRHFAIFGFLISLPILYYLLMRQGMSWGAATILIISLLPAFHSELQSRLLEISPKLHQDIKPIQTIQITTNIIRLFLNGLTLTVFPSAAIAIVVSGLSQLYGSWQLASVSSKFADHTAPDDPEVRQKILKISRQILPTAAYYSLSGQITIWLISLFGETRAIAEVGALGRLALITSIATTIFHLLVVPRFATLPSEPRLLTRRFLQLQCCLACCALALVAFASAFAREILALLGDEYSGLKRELLLMTIASSLSVLCSCTYALNISRQFIQPAHAIIPFAIAIQTTLALLILPKSAAEAFVFSICLSSLLLMTHLSCFAVRTCRLVKN